jgi:hypothetical protein
MKCSALSGQAVLRADQAQFDIVLTVLFSESESINGRFIAGASTLIVLTLADICDFFGRYY